MYSQSLELVTHVWLRGHRMRREILGAGEMSWTGGKCMCMGSCSHPCSFGAGRTQMWAWRMTPKRFEFSKNNVTSWMKPQLLLMQFLIILPLISCLLVCMIQACVNTRNSISLPWKWSCNGRVKVYRGKTFTIFIRSADGAEKTGRLSITKAFLPVRSSEPCPLLGVYPRGIPLYLPRQPCGEQALSGGAWEGSQTELPKRKWCYYAFLVISFSRKTDHNVLYSLSLNTVSVKRLLRVGLSGLSLNTSLKEKLK